MPRKSSSATLKDVAKLAQTSVGTASYVLNSNSQKKVSPELSQRVFSAARVLGYRPNQAARKLKGQSSRLLAIMIPQLENFFFTNVVIGAEQYATERRYMLSIYSTYDNEDRELGFLDNILHQSVDGIIICPANNRSKSVDMIREAGIPFIVVDRCVEGDDFDFVGIDNYRAAYKGTEYLVHNGHRSIAYIGWNSKIDANRDRLEGFLTATSDYGILEDDIVVWEGARSNEVAYKATNDLLQQRTFTALLVGQHQLAEGVIRALQDGNIAVPDDMSVLIYGNPSWTKITSPQYTCISQPDFQMGAKAAELIVAQIESRHTDYARYILETKTALRDSVTAARMSSIGRAPKGEEVIE